MEKNRHAVALGRKGGKARATKLDAQRRIDIARAGGLAAQALKRQLSDKIQEACQQDAIGENS